LFDLLHLIEQPQSIERITDLVPLKQAFTNTLCVQAEKYEHAKSDRCANQPSRAVALFEYFISFPAMI
jgi:hypothetical protein